MHFRGSLERGFFSFDKEKEAERHRTKDWSAPRLWNGRGVGCCIGEGGDGGGKGESALQRRGGSGVMCFCTIAGPSSLSTLSSALRPLSFFGRPRSRHVAGPGTIEYDKHYDSDPSSAGA
jgi:hypothetical protein